MIIDSNLLDALTAQAQESPRLRMNYDLRNSNLDTSQRLLNALEPETVLPIHRHRTTSETIVILRGRATQYLYDDQGNVVEQVALAPQSGVVGMSVEAGRWHRLVCHESGTVILECKVGTYEPLSSDDILNGDGAV